MVYGVGEFEIALSAVEDALKKAGKMEKKGLDASLSEESDDEGNCTMLACQKLVEDVREAYTESRYTDDWPSLIRKHKDAYDLLLPHLQKAYTEVTTGDVLPPSPPRPVKPGTKKRVIKDIGLAAAGTKPRRVQTVPFKVATFQDRMLVLDWMKEKPNVSQVDVVV